MVLVAIALTLLGSLPISATGAPARSSAPTDHAGLSGAALGVLSAAGPAPPDLFGPPYWLGGHIPALVGPAGPMPAIVNPKGFYSGEPAPMGVGDFGINSTGAAYVYNTSRFLGTIQLGSWNAGPGSATPTNGNWTSLQLNVVVVLTNGSSSAQYWIQDVPLYNTSNHGIYIEDNVWNFSSRSAGLTSSSVRGNGTIYGSRYYAAGASASLPGNGVYLSLPVNISTEVVASDIQGTTHVGFLYNDGYGWQIFDNVTFPWTKGWTLHGFVVNGTGYNPAGLFDDAEWIMGGPGGGSKIRDESSNFTMSLSFDNGHNFAAVPNAYGFGSDTAEAEANVEVAPATLSNPLGTPAGRYKAGAGSLALLYGVANDSFLNATGPLASGLLGLNGTTVPYNGSEANLTLRPGPYRFADSNGSAIFAAENATLSAGGYLALAFGTLQFTPSNGLAGATIRAVARNFPVGASVAIDWPGNSTPLCHGTTASNGTASCSFQVPKQAAGPYFLDARGNDSAGTLAATTFQLTTNLTVLLAGNRSSTDVGGSLLFWANATKGFPPYTSYAWQVGTGAPNRTTNSTSVETFPTAGTFVVHVSVQDQVGDTVGASTTIRVDPGLVVTAPIANRSITDVGDAVAFQVNASLGSGGYGYRWSGLPTGCVPSGSTATCGSIPAAGTYQIVAKVNDSNGFSVLSSPLSFVVAPPPAILSIHDTKPFVDVGESFSLQAQPANGSPPFTYTWTGLPTGCASNTSTVDCLPSGPGTFPVTVQATDEDGHTTGAVSMTVSVAPDPVVRVFNGNRTAVDTGARVSFSAPVSGGSGALTYVWLGLPPGCGTSNLSTRSCVFGAVGPARIEVVVIDQSGWQTTANVSFMVYSDPVLSWSGPTPTPRDIGMPLTLAVTARDGAGNYSYAWSGLPSGCASVNGPTLACIPRSAGETNVTATLTDGAGGTATTSSVPVVVHPLPSLTRLGLTPSAPIVGNRLTLSATVQGGTGTPTLHWTGLPTGCASVPTATLSCTPTSAGRFVVTVEVSDSVGQSTNGTLDVAVGPSFLGLPALEGYVLLGGLGAVVAAVAGGLLIRRRRARTTSPPPVPP